MYVCFLRFYDNAYVCLQLFASILTSAHASICIDNHVCMYMHMYMYMCMGCLCMCLCICVCVCVYVNVYVYK